MNRPQKIIALDPGTHGALASYTTTYSPPGGPAWTVEKLSESPQDRFSQILGHYTASKELEAPLVAILEDVGGYVGISQPGSRMFTFGRNFGQLEGILASLSYQIIRIRPQAWQKILSLQSRRGESKPDHKKRMRMKALDLFPTLKPSADTCDALLILHAYMETRAKLNID